MSSLAQPGKPIVNRHKAQAQEPLSISVATAETRKLSRTISVTGSLSPDQTVTVSAQVAGRLAAIHFDFGQRVKKGDVIAAEVEALGAERALADYYRWL